MRDLIEQEKFEIEVLDRLNKGKYLDSLVLVGGTMLRLCYDLNRFSIDLDFWIIKKMNTDSFFKKLRKYLSGFYILKDAANKYNTLLFELKSDRYKRSLKIEIRKRFKKVKTEMAIAYSKYSNIQVLLRVLSLEEMMKNKIEAFLNRGEIRDVFDIEFLLKRGIELPQNAKLLKKLLKKIEMLKPADYKVKLGSILDEKDRKYYIKENFKILKYNIKSKLR